MIKRSDGRSAVAAAAYRAAEKFTDARTGLTHDFTAKKGVDFSAVLLPADAPAEYADRGTLWGAVEKVERRKDAQVAREINVALPVELSHDEKIALAREFVQAVFVDAGMVADLCLHDLNSPNPHAHVMLSTRHVSPDGFGKKNTAWNSREQLCEWREQWAEHANNALEQAGHAERIDHRTLAAQGIVDREPQVHLGPARHAMQQRGVDTYSVARQLERQRLKRAAQDAAAAKIAEAEAQARVDFLAAQLNDVQEQRRRNDERRIDAIRERISDIRTEIAGAERHEQYVRERISAVTADTSRGEAAVRRLERRSEKLREEKQELERELERARAIAAAVTRAATRALGAVTGGLAQWRDRRAAQRRAEAHAERLRAELEREKERHEKAERVLRELEDWSGEAAGSIERLAEQLAAEESRHAALRTACSELERMAATPDQRAEIERLAKNIRTARARSGVRLSSADALATAKERYEQRHAAVQPRPRPTTPAPTQYNRPKG